MSEQASSTSAAPGSASAEAKATTGVADDKQASLWSDAWYQLRRSPMFIVSALLIVLILLIAIFPGWFTDTSPVASDLSRSLERPSAEHWFGFDIQGRDYYARVIYGARASVAVGLLVVLTASIIAVTLGSLAGYYGGAIDAVIARVTDVFFALPTILGGLVLLTVLDNRGVPQVAMVLAVLGWPTMMRLMRSSVLAAARSDYVQAARALGASDGRIMRRHILPNAVTPVVVYATIFVGIVITAEAALTFLGVGLQTPAISWGLMISQAQTRLLEAPHLLLFPGAFLSVTVFSFILMGDALRDALDPKLR
ncbi:ABC transporter permease [Egicoccus sp. AB-alg2]|uniref:ABC transporter permease n=1 Tax=Egicoccus sp. AB-alg2 TaxID=3242693 RepID=UPI00359D3A85